MGGNPGPTMPRRLPDPPSGDDDIRSWVAQHLGDLCAPTDSDAAPALRGGQRAADAALQAYDVRGYARRRNNVWPTATRGSSRLSPYIRHGLLTLREVWDHVADGPRDDVAKFRDELLWQEYARHLYARMGTASRKSLRFTVDERATGVPPGDADNPWVSEALCLESSFEELMETGWLTNQTRMWLA
ncbi:MAG: deoxyribodipyrimidine photolyase, partial [Mycobacterium sp.]|nr:deoxyribodipyrimidine photolyase [Mycobacterium sp.]